MQSVATYLSRIFRGIALVSYIPVRARLGVSDIERRGSFSPLRASFFVCHWTEGGGGRGRHGREDNERRKERKDKERIRESRAEGVSNTGWVERRSGPANRLAVELDDASVQEYVALNVVLVDLHNRLVLFTSVWLVAVSPIVPFRQIDAHHPSFSAQ